MSCVSPNIKYAFDQAQRTITFGSENPLQRQRELRKKIVELIGKKSFVLSKMGDFFTRNGCDGENPRITHTRCITLRRIYHNYSEIQFIIVYFNKIFIDYFVARKKHASPNDLIKIEKMVWYIMKIAESRVNPTYKWWVNNFAKNEPESIPRTEPLPRMM
ncbi:hypothetical protein KKH43_01595 [Patescibacteria group bacterium]|nr:hypothetical protein [Patescibacteria group bacterium]